MKAANQLNSLQPAGGALLVTVVIFLIGASVAAYFRRWPLPTDPLDQLTIIANDRAGWTAQAIIFPAAYLATAIIFALIAARLPGTGPRWLAGAAIVLAVAACLLWLPVSTHRLQLGANAAEMLRTYDPAAPPVVSLNLSVFFWANTLSLLAALALMGAALALAGILPVLGWIISGLAVAGAIVGLLVWQDWPPFASYILVLVLAIGLLRSPS